MRIWTLVLLGLGAACQPLDETTHHRTTAQIEDVEWASGEIPDEAGWSDQEMLLPSELSDPVAGTVPVDEQQRYLHDRLGWPGDIEGVPPYSLDDTYWFNGSKRLTWCLRQPSTRLSESGTKLALQASANEWFWNAGFQIREVECEWWSPTCTANIEVRFLTTADPEYDDILLVDPDTMFYANASASPPTTGACTTMYFNDHKDFTLDIRGDDPDPPFDIQSTALHELGHTLGLCHPFEYIFDSDWSIIGTEVREFCTPATDLDIDLCEGPGTHPVMCPYYDGTGRTLTPDDTAAIHARYGPSDGVCNDGYVLADEAYRLIEEASTEATALHEDYTFDPAYETGADELAIALDWAGKLQAAAEEAMSTEPGFGLVATRHLYEAQTHTAAGVAAYGDDILASDIVRPGNEALNVLPVIYELEDYCYVEEYGEHEDGS